MKYNNVFEINNYREACKFLQEKYDALGYVRKDYYHTTGADSHLTKTSGVGHGDVGLQYHHICEDLVPSLSNKDVATANPIEYQSADNMCYCNLLEHAWLHVLITEANATATDEDQDAVTGLGGVKWMFIALNSIYADPSASWYSKKTYLEADADVADEDRVGMTYNYNNIITDHKDDYLKVVNRFCTSSFIRQRLNMTPVELAATICLSCKSDETVRSLYEEIMAEAKTTKLFDHNVGAFCDLEKYLEDNASALVYICTSGGKTTTGLEYLRIHGGHALALGPSDTIKNGWDKDKDGNPLPNVTAMNYQTFMNCYDALDWNKYTMIFADEAHHVAAERWGEGLRWVLANRPEVKIIGLTATPTDNQFNGTDVEFGGRICYGLDLAEGIKSGKIWPFGYIQSIYKMEEVKDEFDAYGAVGTQLWERLNLQLNQNPIQKILKDKMPAGQRKIIVFCQSTGDLDDAVTAMHQYDPTLEIRKVTSKEDKDANDNAKTWFNDTTDKNVCILTVNMVNEGAHYKGVNTLVMFRRTNSTTLYIQQLGRLVANKQAVTVDPNGIVFDFTNNAENLIYNSTIQLDEEVKTPTVKAEQIERVKRAIQSLGSEVIYQDYTEDCAKTLAALDETKNTNKQGAVIYSAFNDVKNELATEFKELFDFDLWEELKTTSGTVNIEKPRHAQSSATRSAMKAAGAGTGGTRTTASVSDIQKLAEAFRLTVKRAYNFGCIDFAEDHTCKMIVNDVAMLDTLVKSAGFKNTFVFTTVADKLSKHTFLLATSM